MEGSYVADLHSPTRWHGYIMLARLMMWALSPSAASAGGGKQVETGCECASCHAHSCDALKINWNTHLKIHVSRFETEQRQEGFSVSVRQTGSRKITEDHYEVKHIIKATKQLHVYFMESIQTDTDYFKNTTFTPHLQREKSLSLRRLVICNAFTPMLNADIQTDQLILQDTRTEYTTTWEQ